MNNILFTLILSMLWLIGLITKILINAPIYYLILDVLMLIFCSIWFIISINQYKDFLDIENNYFKKIHKRKEVSKK